MAIYGHSQNNRASMIPTYHGKGVFLPPTIRWLLATWRGTKRGKVNLLLMRLPWCHWRLAWQWRKRGDVVPWYAMIWYVKDCFSVFDVAVADLKATKTLLERSTIRGLIAVMILWYLTSLKSIWFILFILRVQKNLKGNNSRTILGSVNLAWFGRTMILKHNHFNEWHPTWSVTVALKITIPTRSRHELPERSYDKKALDLLFLEAWKDADSPFIQFYQLGRSV